MIDTVCLLGICYLKMFLTLTLFSGRVMVLPSSKGYYVAERFDTPYLSPPPLPPQHIPIQGQNHPSSAPGYTQQSSGHIQQSSGHSQSSAGQIQQVQGHPASAQGFMQKGPGPMSHGPPLHNLPPYGMHVPQGYKEWEGSQQEGGKIVNRPTKPYKDKFKPSYVCTYCHNL